jgi:hypothetical protein
MLKDLNSIPSDFSFNSTEGLLEPKTKFTLSFAFSSNKVSALKKAIKFDILDPEKTHVFTSYSIGITAESFEALYDFNYPPQLNHLDYKQLRVEQISTIFCVLKNRGKYPFNHQIEKIFPPYSKFLEIPQTQVTYLQEVNLFP